LEGRVKEKVIKKMIKNEHVEQVVFGGVTSGR
jgi:hypothetical protein